MRFSVAIPDISKAIGKTKSVFTQKSPIVVLEHLHFSLEGSMLSIVATDRDMTIKTSLTVEGFRDGSVLIPGKILSDTLTALSESKSMIEFDTNEENFDIQLITNKATYNVKGLDPDEYVDLPELFNSERPQIANMEGSTTACKINKDVMSKLATKTVFAVSEDDFRPAMTGVLFEFKGDRIIAVATDSFRLVRYMIVGEANQFINDLKVIIPSKTVDQLKKVEEDVIISIIESNEKATHVRFDMENTVMISKIIDEKYPPYETVIPSSTQILCMVDKSEFLKALKRVSFFTSKITKQVKIVLENGALEIKGEDIESGTSAHEAVNCDYTGEKFEIGFNHAFLNDAFNNIDTTNENFVYLSFNETNKPALMTPDGVGDELLMLIMPVRL